VGWAYRLGSELPAPIDKPCGQRVRQLRRKASSQSASDDRPAAAMDAFDGSAGVVGLAIETMLALADRPLLGVLVQPDDRQILNVLESLDAAGRPVSTRSTRPDGDYARLPFLPAHVAESPTIVHVAPRASSYTPVSPPIRYHNQVIVTRTRISSPYSM
jgi:hypothetical protein